MGAPVNCFVNILSEQFLRSLLDQSFYFKSKFKADEVVEVINIDCLNHAAAPSQALPQQPSLREILMEADINDGDIQFLVDEGVLAVDSLAILGDSSFSLVGPFGLNPWSTSASLDGPVGAGDVMQQSVDGPVVADLSPGINSAYDGHSSDGPVGAGIAPSISCTTPSTVGGGWFDSLERGSSSSLDGQVSPHWRMISDNVECCDFNGYGFLDCFKHNRHQYSFNTTVFHDQWQSTDWYWSYREGMYVCIDKFSCIDRKDIYLYPLIFEETDWLYPIVEDPASDGSLPVSACNVLITSSDEYLRSEQCSDKYTLPGDEKPFHRQIFVLWRFYLGGLCTKMDASIVSPPCGLSPQGCFIYRH